MSGLFTASILVRSAVAFAKLAEVVCCPIPFMKTGLSMLRAFSSDTNGIADAPSQGAEQSSLIGDAIFLNSSLLLRPLPFQKEREDS